MDNRPTRCLIVDDEPLAIRVLQNHLEKIPDIEVVETASDALEAFDIIRKQSVDLVFLDIHMPELSGIDLVRALENPPRIIFTTAYREYALEGFELDVVDYLLKPVSLPRLLRAVDKYRRLGTESSPDPATPTETQYLTLRSDRRNVKIRLDDIRFIESVGDYTKVHASGPAIVSRQRISALADKLEPHGFIRIHRSFLASSDRITSFTSDQVMIGEVTLPVSRSYRVRVLERLEGRDL